MKRQKLEVQKREIIGRKVYGLRKQGLLPANLFGKKIKSEAVQVKIDEFKKIWNDVGETVLFDVELEGKIHPVLIHNVQFHPTTGLPLHADFHEVSLTEKTTASVPLELVGESPAVEEKLGVLIQTLSEVSVEALPADLPEKLTVDISVLLQVGDMITVADVKVDSEKIKILAEATETIVKINPLAKEEVVVPPPVAEGEVAGEGAPAPTEGGEVPAEETTGEVEPAKKE